MPRQEPLALCLMGPTAVGKTDAAVELARRCSADGRVGVISVDSAMVYRGMDIGTGKPSPAILAEVPHRLVDVRDPWERYSAGDFVREARAAMADVNAAGRIPVLVGGTMLYFRSLLEGISALPEGDPAVRAELDDQASREGWPALHAALATIDPEAAERIEPGDRQRIQRALEVHRLTGKPLTSLQGRTDPLAGYRVVKIAIVPADRSALHARIERRVHGMLDAGFVEEVKRLMTLPSMDADRPAMRAVGYRQLWDMLAAGHDPGETAQRIVAATRQLARRQLTWLRRESCHAWLEMGSPTLVTDIETILASAAESDAI